MIYADLNGEQQLKVLNQMNALTSQDPQAIEKDWWLTQVLRVLFAQPYAEHLSFKGGTSLSKAWGLIERFSEDIDIAISREFLGFTGELSRTQVSDKLRRASCKFVRTTMKTDVENGLSALGINPELFNVHVDETSVTTVDPEVIFVDYHSVLPDSEYIAHTVKVEVSGRSMSEPLKRVALQSLIDKVLPQSSIVQPEFEASVVMPERTFLEKVMLLHEEFARPIDDVRTKRMSRHLYDLHRMMKTEIAERALNDDALYRTIVEHRRKFIGLKGFDYDTLYPKLISLRIPEDVLPLWRKDYEQMQESMIYGKSVSFDELLEAIQQLEERLHSKN